MSSKTNWEVQSVQLLDTVKIKDETRVRDTFVVPDEICKFHVYVVVPVDKNEGKEYYRDWIDYVCSKIFISSSLITLNKIQFKCRDFYWLPFVVTPAYKSKPLYIV